MKNLLSLVRPAARMFSTARPAFNSIRVPPRSMEPQNVRDLVSFNAKYTKVADLTPLKEARELYARIHIHNWNMLVTEGDIVKIPANMKDVKIGDTLIFDQVSEIGSRNHTLSGERIDPSQFSIKGVVLEKTRVKRSVLERTRRRRRHVRHVVANNSLTVIRVSEVKVA